MTLFRNLLAIKGRHYNAAC